MRPKWSRSGNTSSCIGRNAPPESTRYRHSGRVFRSRGGGGPDLLVAHWASLVAASAPLPQRALTDRLTPTVRQPIGTRARARVLRTLVDRVFGYVRLPDRIPSFPLTTSRGR